MQTISRALGAACIGAALLTSAALPAQSQEFSFGFGNMGPSHDGGGQWRDHDWNDDNWDHGDNWDYPSMHHHRHYRHMRSGGSISFSISIPVRSSWAVHVRRCEARYGSYDRYSDTYIGLDYREHRCRL